jgi:hypothetical protein
MATQSLPAMQRVSTACSKLQEGGDVWLTGDETGQLVSLTGTGEFGELRGCEAIRTLALNPTGSLVAVAVTSPSDDVKLFEYPGREMKEGYVCRRQLRINHLEFSKDGQFL